MLTWGLRGTRGGLTHLPQAPEKSSSDHCSTQPSQYLSILSHIYKHTQLLNTEASFEGGWRGVVAPKEKEKKKKKENKKKRKREKKRKERKKEGNYD